MTDCLVENPQFNQNDPNLGISKSVSDKSIHHYQSNMNSPNNVDRQTVAAPPQSHQMVNSAQLRQDFTNMNLKMNQPNSTFKSQDNNVPRPPIPPMSQQPMVSLLFLFFKIHYLIILSVVAKLKYIFCFL